MTDNGRIRVVIADDDAAFLEALATAMEIDGRFEVVGLAANGGEAFQMACWHEPDVTVMDVEMPVMRGPEAARLLRQSRPRGCVLMVSGADEVHAHGVDTADADLFVSKSDLHAIVDAVAALATPVRRVR